MRYFTFPLGVILALFLGAPLLLFIADFFLNKQIGQNLITTLIASGMGSWAGAWFVWHKTQEEKQEQILTEMNALSIELEMFKARFEYYNQTYLRPLRNELRSYKSPENRQISFEFKFIPMIYQEQVWGAAINVDRVMKYANAAPEFCRTLLVMDEMAKKVDSASYNLNQIILAYRNDGKREAHLANDNMYLGYSDSMIKHGSYLAKQLEKISEERLDEVFHVVLEAAYFRRKHIWDINKLLKKPPN